MAAKHSVRVFGTARFVLSFAVAILVFLVVWIAMRAVGPAEASKQPTVVLPSVPRVTLAAPVSPTVAASKSPTPSRTPATARTTSPVREKTRKPTTRPATTAPAPRSDVEVTVSVGASWDEGYVAAVRVVNEGDEAVAWRVTVSHSGLRELRLRGVWNATGDQRGDSLVFSGARLAPGATANFGYQTSKSGRGSARPTGCNAVGGSCSVR